MNSARTIIFPIFNGTETQLKMKFLLPLFLVISISGFAQTSSKPISIGETLTFHSEVLNEDRQVNVYLPQDYHPDSLKTYHVIYLLDGSLDEDFIHIAGLVQFSAFPWIQRCEESIVVGISNIDRKRDYTFPTNNEQDKKDFPTTGGSASFISFIEKELQPMIESTYSTDSTSTLIGQSLGGLLATEILFKHDHLFENYVIVSPSLWWDDESLLAYNLEEETNAKKVFVAVGAEGNIMVPEAEGLYQKLLNTYGDTVALDYQYFPENDHGDVLHEAVYNSFEHIFSKQN